MTVCTTTAPQTPITAGQALPDLPLKLVINGTFVDSTVAERWGQGRHILFGLPGAFTPTCSAKHLPGFVDHAQALRDKGIASITCLSVNDLYVMRAWAEDQHCGSDIDMLADGNATLTRALGLTRDATANGMGIRCQRCALILADGQAEQVFIEKPGDFMVSAADHVLRAL